MVHFDDSFVSDVVDKGGIEPLITLLNDAKQLVQANAAVCLTNLATEGMLYEDFFVVELFGSLWFCVSLKFLICFVNLPLESWRSEIQQRGVVPALVQALQSKYVQTF